VTDKFTHSKMECVDCHAALPGLLTVRVPAAHLEAVGPVTVAWLCPTCLDKYPSLAAAEDRGYAVSIRMLDPVEAHS
jgi:hypothetical protein